MKKLPFIILVVLVLGAIASPAILGVSIKSDIRNEIENINALTAYKITEVDYQSGWRNSEATFQVELRGFDELAAEQPEMAEFLDTFKVTTTIDIVHGPFLPGQGFGLASWTSYLHDLEYLRSYVEWDEDRHLFETTGWVGLNGDIHFQEFVPEINALDSATINFHFGGYVSNGSSVDGYTLYSGESGNTEIYSPQGKLDIGPFSLEMNMAATLDQALSGELFDSSISFSISEIKLQGMQTVELMNLGVSGDVEMQPGGQLADLTARYSLESLAAEALDIHEVTLEIGIDNYSNEFQKSYMEFSLANMSNIDIPTEAAEQFVLESLPLLLEPGPSFGIQQFAFTLPEGSFDSSLSIKLDPITDLPANPLENPIFWLDKVLATFSLSADEEVIHKIVGYYIEEQAGESLDGLEKGERNAMVQSQLQTLVGMAQGLGFVQLTDGKYTSKLLYDHGSAVVNGQPYALPFGAPPTSTP